MSDVLTIQPWLLDECVTSLRARERLVFSRWGDGEWAAILGHGSQNCDGQPYTPDLRRGLMKVLQSRPSYRLGLQGLALRRFGDQIDRWLRHESLTDLAWCDADIFHRASIHDRLSSLIEALRERGVVLVGPARLAGLSSRLRIVAHVVIPDEQAYDSADRWIDQAWRRATHAGPTVVVAVSAGMGGKILVHRLARTLGEHSIVDFGSVWEPYVGHLNRTYHAAVRRRVCAQELAS